MSDATSLSPLTFTMPSQKMTRYYIPHPHEPGCEIAGDLEQVEPELPTHGRKVALVCLLSSSSATKLYVLNPSSIRFYMELWGRLSHKLGMLLHQYTSNSHKNYLFQKRLAKLLPMDSFRFDFRYVHESAPSIVGL